MVPGRLAADRWRLTERFPVHQLSIMRSMADQGLAAGRQPFSPHMVHLALCSPERGIHVQNLATAGGDLGSARDPATRHHRPGRPRLPGRGGGLVVRRHAPRLPHARAGPGQGAHRRDRRLPRFHPHRLPGGRPREHHPGAEQGALPPAQRAVRARHARRRLQGLRAARQEQHVGHHLHRAQELRPRGRRRARARLPRAAGRALGAGAHRPPPAQPVHRRRRGQAQGLDQARHEARHAALRPPGRRHPAPDRRRGRRARPRARRDHGQRRPAHARRRRTAARSSRRPPSRPRRRARPT